jgi:hypothetical protein
MKTKHLVLSILFTTLFISCQKDTIKSGELIFGDYHGECMGDDCVKIFKLTDDKLYQDTDGHYPSLEEYKGDFEKLSNTEFNKVKDLKSHLPTDLLSANNQTFGCPDCVDQGGYFVQYNNDGEINFWKIDKFKNDIPSYLHDFTDKLGEYIDLING